MSIQAVSNNNVSFGHIKTTKQGNEYKKTHAATRTGLAVGVAAAASNVFFFKKVLKDLPGFKRALSEALVTARNTLMQSGQTKEAATKLAKKLPKIVVGAAMAYSILGWFALGAGVNKIINHNRAKKADNAAAQQAK